MTAPAGSEDAGLVLSAEERLRDDLAVHVTCYAAGRCDGPQMLAGVLATVAAHVEAARAEERERVAAALEFEASQSTVGPAYLAAARIARTLPPAEDAQGSQEARNGPVSAGEAGDGRGHGRDDESGRGAGL